MLLPGVPSGGGYVVYFVNTTQPSQVFTMSQPFNIEDGAGELPVSRRRRRKEREERELIG